MPPFLHYQGSSFSCEFVMNAFTISMHMGSYCLVVKMSCWPPRKESSTLLISLTTAESSQLQRWPFILMWVLLTFFSWVLFWYCLVRLSGSCVRLLLSQSCQIAIMHTCRLPWIFSSSPLTAAMGMTCWWNTGILMRNSTKVSRRHRNPFMVWDGIAVWWGF